MPASSASVRPLAFFALTFALSWLVWVPLTAAHFGLGPVVIPDGISNVVRLLGVLMPAVSALWLTARAGGRAQVRELLGRLGQWRVGWRWWAAAGLGQPALLIVIALVYNAAGGQPPVTAPLNTLGAVIVNGVLLLLATLGEEIGWRGLALPALQQRYSALTASLILGVVWATWHVPFWLLLDTFDHFGPGYLALNFLLIVPSTLYITWFFNHGRSSLLLAVVFHITFNLTNVIWLPVTTHPGAFVWLIAAEWLIAGLLVPRLQPASHPAPALSHP